MVVRGLFWFWKRRYSHDNTPFCCSGNGILFFKNNCLTNAYNRVELNIRFLEMDLQKIHLKLGSVTIDQYFELVSSISLGNFRSSYLSLNNTEDVYYENNVQ